MRVDAYQCGQFFDELFDSHGKARALTEPVVRRLQALSNGDVQASQRAAQVMLQNMGITFNVYGQGAGTERIWPLDLVPRIIEFNEWERIERGLRQRIEALNLFIDDLYHDQRIIKDKVIPEYLIASCPGYRAQCKGLKPPHGAWCHVTGTDLVRDSDGQMYVLEDNARVPSGVSYVLENREVMKRTFPQVFEGLSVLPVEQYPERLLETLTDCAPPHAGQPRVVVLTPGIYNSAYFEHSFLAQQMGVELVQGSDLLVHDQHVYMQTTHGLQQVDVIYRRIDDDFLDPKVFRSDSMLGVSGLMEAYLAGNVTLCNAPGTGVADDKAIYAYVPKVIEYYLQQEPLIPNVPTYLASDEQDRQYILEHLHELVVKPTNSSGGYGIMFGGKATQAERDAYAAQIRENPRNYIAQPVVNLSTVPSIIDDQLEGRHVDLRPFILCGKKIYVMPGGLTRVALPRGSMIVNSSQGGGSKDTWVLAGNQFQSQSQNSSGQMQSQHQTQAGGQG